MNEFLQRLKERKLVQWALAYMAAAFALIQVADIVAQRFGWPEQSVRFIIIALVVGFFVTLVLAWYHGERGAQRVTGTELSILALLLMIGGGLLWRVAQGTHEAVASLSAKAGGASTPGAASATAASAALPIADKSIAVLPFENLSDDKANSYFTGGMRDEILTRLAGIHALKVVSRTSTEQYASHPADIKTVGEQLGVAAVLEGSVQKSGDSTHINVQLIDARSDTHLWAESYDRDLKNIFAVERDVAEKVADALKAQLLPEEALRVASIPTRNSDAYDLYLRGLAHFNRANDEYVLTTVEIPQAIPLFEEALAKDPDFALAASALAKAHMNAYWFGPDRTDARLAQAKTMAERALALQPDLGNAHYALGLYLYWGFRDYAAAHAQFALARTTLPNDADIEVTDAAIFRRRGKLDEAIAGFQRAAILAPHSGGPSFNLAQCYMQLRQYAQADRLFARAAEVTADPDVQLIRRGESWVYWKGDIAPMRAAIAALRPGTELYAANRYQLQLVAWWSRDFAAAAAIVAADPDGNWYDSVNIALPKPLYQAWAYAAEGEDAKAKSIYVDVQTAMHTAIAERPRDADRHLALAFAEAGLGFKQEAIAEARKAAELMPVSVDAFTGPGYLRALAKVYVQVGENGQAIDVIEKLLAIPAGAAMSPGFLKIDPSWDALRSDPRFQAVLNSSDTSGKSASHE